MIRDVIAQSGEDALVNIEEKVERTDANVKAGQMRQEIIADEEAQEHNVIDQPFERYLPKRHVGTALELVGQIFAQYRHGQSLQRLALILQQLHGRGSRFLVQLTLSVGEASFLPPPLCLLLTLPTKDHLLPQDVEMSLVRGESEHDQIGVQAMKDVDDVGIVVRLRSLQTDVGHNLMLPLTGDRGVAENNPNAPPGLVGRYTLPDVKPNILGQVEHESGPGSNNIRIPRPLLLRGDPNATVRG
mmetsp:Transcript_1584/g.3779  ORF Transcript_1584/g.3779 Transcript_1584/m.3779 type:complete len:244 (-) Transcript_1584:563-1294(-)